jgi:hypothetical protein
MGYADGFYYGQGRIICDTSTFSVGDTIRVRSVYNVSQTEDKQVVTVGTPLIFTVPPYDYYKICKVESNTEVGGEFVTIDYGQTINTKVVDKTTLGGIQAILNSHNEADILNIGDESTIRIYDGGVYKDWVMQIAKIDSSNHSVILASKNIYTTSKYQTSNAGGYRQILKSLVNTTFYDSIGTEKQYIKEMPRTFAYTASEGNFAWATYTNDKVWLPTNLEVFGSLPLAWSTYPTITQTQFPLFTTQANRIRTYNGTATEWCTSDMANTNYNVMMVGNGGGSNVVNGTTTTAGVLPCFMMEADS